MIGSVLYLKILDFMLLETKIKTRTILGIILGVGFLFSVITTVSYVDAQDSTLDDSDDVTQYNAPLRQIRDDGILPQDVKCNVGKVLFFKVSNKSPVCICEDSIEKLNSKDSKFMFWSLKSQLVDWNYLKEKTNEFEFSEVTNISIFDEVNNTETNVPVIILEQPLITLSTDPVFYHLNLNHQIFTTNLFDVSFSDDPRFDIYKGNKRLPIFPPTIEIQCNDKSSKILNIDPAIYPTNTLDGISLKTISKSFTPDFNYVQVFDDYSYQYIFWSIFPTEFNTTENMLITNIEKMECVSTDLYFVNMYNVIYRYVLQFEVTQ